MAASNCLQEGDGIEDWSLHVVWIRQENSPDVIASTSDRGTFKVPTKSGANPGTKGEPSAWSTTGATSSVIQTIIHFKKSRTRSHRGVRTAARIDT